MQLTHKNAAFCIIARCKLANAVMAGVDNNVRALKWLCSFSRDRGAASLHLLMDQVCLQTGWELGWLEHLHPRAALPCPTSIRRVEQGAGVVALRGQ